MNPNELQIPAPRKAEKHRVKLKIGIQGPSGSGKTEGALALAKNLMPDAKVLVIDTENESASLYADRYDFDTIPLSPPFTTKRYEQCIEVAVKNGYDILILDSVSHQWDGEGGILRRKEILDQRPDANTYVNWSKFTPEHTHFIETIKQAPIHIIATIRSKTEYVLTDDARGKKKPVKVGMAPIQRDGFDYEFSLIFDVQMDHRAVVSKNRTSLFEDEVVDLCAASTAERLRNWMQSGVETPKNVERPKPIASTSSGAQPLQPPVMFGYEREDGVLNCVPMAVEKRKKKNGSGEVLALKMNGQVHGSDMAFCWHLSLTDALMEAKGKQTLLHVKENGEYLNIEDVISIAGQAYKDGKPFTEDPLTVTHDEATEFAQGGAA